MLLVSLNLNVNHVFVYIFTRAVCIQIAGKMPYLEMEKKCDKHSDLKHFSKDVNILANKTRNVGYASCQLTFNLIFSHILEITL